MVTWTVLQEFFTPQYPTLISSLMFIYVYTCPTSGWILGNRTSDRWNFGEVIRTFLAQLNLPQYWIEVILFPLARPAALADRPTDRLTNPVCNRLLHQWQQQELLNCYPAAIFPCSSKSYPAMTHISPIRSQGLRNCLLSVIGLFVILFRK